MSVENKNIELDWKSLEVRKSTNLPHWSCNNAIYHVSFRLNDSIPNGQRDEWLWEREHIIKNAEQMGRELTDCELKKLQYLYSERVEKYLDAGHGECYLALPEIGQLVAGSLEYFNNLRYSLHAYCVMPNHVHVIVEPLYAFDLTKIAHSWKSYTANQANKMLKRNGAFWQHEPYDHIIRSEKEYFFQVDYVWNNPGKMKSGFIRKKW